MMTLGNGALEWRMERTEKDGRKTRWGGEEGPKAERTDLAIDSRNNGEYLSSIEVLSVRPSRRRDVSKLSRKFASVRFRASPDFTFS